VLPHARGHDEGRVVYPGRQLRSQALEVPQPIVRPSQEELGGERARSLRGSIGAHPGAQSMAQSRPAPFGDSFRTPPPLPTRLDPLLRPCTGEHGWANHGGPGQRCTAGTALPGCRCRGSGAVPTEFREESASSARRDSVRQAGGLAPPRERRGRNCVGTDREFGSHRIPEESPSPLSRVGPSPVFVPVKMSNAEPDTLA
jgi:hypothetical protein